MKRATIDDHELVTLNKQAGLELSEERRAALLPTLNEVVLPGLAVLDTVDVGETPPAHTFDPRWGATS